VKPVTAARGSRVSRPAVAGLALASGAGPRSSRPNPSSVRTAPDPGAVERGALGAQPGADLVHRQPCAAQLDRPGAGAVLGRGGLGAGLAGRGEQLQLPGAEVA